VCGGSHDMIHFRDCLKALISAVVGLEKAKKTAFTPLI
jgi:hypothetical protein